MSLRRCVTRQKVTAKLVWRADGECCYQLGDGLVHRFDVEIWNKTRKLRKATKEEAQAAFEAWLTSLGDEPPELLSETRLS